MEMVTPFLMSLLPQSLSFVVWIGAVVVAGLRWQRQPRVAMLVVLASVAMALLALAGTFVSVVMPMRLRESGRTMSEVGVLLTGWSTVLGVLRAGCWAMLVVAAFGWRSSGPALASSQPR